jgi:hypothetical protein
MMEVHCYCLDCRGVLVPTGEKKRVIDADGEDALLRARGISRGPIGRSETNGTALGIEWMQLMGSMDLPRIRVQQLYKDWNAHDQRTPLVHDELCKLIGLSKVVTSRPIETPCGPISVDHNTARHPLAPVSPTRYDADHCSYFGLILTTLTAPLEIWLAEASATKPRRLRYLAGYIVGLTITTHLVIVDEAAKRVITAYRLTDHETRTEGKRSGLPVYQAWK